MTLFPGLFVKEDQNRNAMAKPRERTNRNGRSNNGLHPVGTDTKIFDVDCKEVPVVLGNGFVFISGPYRGRPDPRYWGDSLSYFGIDDNISEARRWASYFAIEGIPFFCPHLNSAHFEVITPDVPEDFWLQMDLEILQHASAIYMIEGWENSEGATEEKRIAEKWGIPVYEDFDTLVEDWLGY